MSSINLPGRYLDESGAERDCMLRGDTREALEITGGHIPVAGERIVCRIPGLGLLTGRVAEPTNGAFRLELEAGPAQRDRLAARLAWHAAQAGGASDRREAVRVVPIRTEVSLSGTVLRSSGTCAMSPRTGHRSIWYPVPKSGQQSRSAGAVPMSSVTPTLALASASFCR
ncbi:hypothetical protein FHR71_003963 [Methylobacterium sp. RAS18]|nr:hypothetical protein [Methylobacterium sp. RAS18]